MFEVNPTSRFYVQVDWILQTLASDECRLALYVFSSSGTDDGKHYHPRI